MYNNVNLLIFYSRHDTISTPCTIIVILGGLVKIIIEEVNRRGKLLTVDFFTSLNLVNTKVICMIKFNGLYVSWLK